MTRTYSIVALVLFLVFSMVIGTVGQAEAQEPSDPMASLEGNTSLSELSTYSDSIQDLMESLSNTIKRNAQIEIDAEESDSEEFITEEMRETLLENVHSLESKAATTNVDQIIDIETVQTFTQESVSKEDIRTILRVALSAYDPAEHSMFLVALSDGSLMSEIVSDSMGLADGEYAELTDEMSKLAIIIYANESAFAESDFAVGRVCQNIVIAADALGYGTKLTRDLIQTLNGTNHDYYCEEMGVNSNMTAKMIALVGHTETSNAISHNALEDAVSIIDG